MKINFASYDSYSASVEDLAKSKDGSDIASNSNYSNINFVFDSARRKKKIEDQRIK